MKNSATHEYMENLNFSWTDDSIRFINTATPKARQTFFYVQEAGDFSTFPPYFTERENLNSFLLIYTLSGKGLLKYQNNTFTLFPGSLAYIDCMNHHYYECLKKQQWKFLWLHFNGPSALGYYEEFLRNNFRILDSLDPFFMESTLRRILSITQKKDLHSEILISSLITEILTQILIENETEQLCLGLMPDFLNTALKEIDTHFREPLTLEYLADKTGISKYHFAREFKRYIGTPPNEYLIITRLNHSKVLLKYKNISVEEIAFACGFHQVSHFIRLFKKHEGCTPLNFRKAWCSNEPAKPPSAR